MREVLVPPSITKVTIDAIKHGLSVINVDGVHVGSEKPKDTGSTVTVNLVGGVQPNLVTDTGRVVVNVYAGKKPDAEHLASLVRAVLNASKGLTLGGVFIRDVKTGVAQFYPDPDSRSPRYQIFGEVTAKITPL